MNDNTVHLVAPQNLTRDHENVLLGPNEDFRQTQDRSKASLNYNPHATEELPTPDFFSMKGHLPHGSYGSSSQNQNESIDKHIMGEESDMDLVYLQMTFSGVSVQSLTEVYNLNLGDLEATIDMLNQLESFERESFGNLPDTLDIGDVSESGTSAECASSKSKKVVGEASSSPAGFSDPGTIT